MKRCKVAFVGRGKTKKMICKTHRQYLFYIYERSNAIYFVCQVGEDEFHSEQQRKRILGKEESKKFDKAVAVKGD